MDFPSFEKNAPRPTQAVTIEPPEVDADASAEERYIQQQWIDAEKSGVAAEHPLSLNRDSDFVTADPYTS